MKLSAGFLPLSSVSLVFIVPALFVGREQTPRKLLSSLKPAVCDAAKLHLVKLGCILHYVIYIIVLILCYMSFNIPPWSL